MMELEEFISQRNVQSPMISSAQALLEEIKKVVPETFLYITYSDPEKRSSFFISFSFFNPVSNKREAREEGVVVGVQILLQEELTVASDVVWNDSGNVLSEMPSIRLTVKQAESDEAVNFALSQVEFFVSQQALLIAENLK